MAKELFWKDMMVICPHCGSAGTVHFDREKNIALFQCDSCYAKQETVSCGVDNVEINAQCTLTGRFFRNIIPKHKVHGQKVKVKCPYCGELIAGDVVKDMNEQKIIFQNVRNAEDPYFHYPLYFQAQYRGKVIWALNREHLQYLITYLSADIRTASEALEYQFSKLPTFMKTAKNRDGIVKLLMKLQEK
ncbi:hypothetical protein C809_01715 [Lachnospiraceae bacterium MD335]|nr:hypothetical protein C809_01715 [Lachnospiraceae bacterium MD335]